ncbi:hypothetical protein Q3G72_004890 [Acer saccharum]|nr:hypothetical protein Q3G72_004890 [Acer saccharum]
MNIISFQIQTCTKKKPLHAIHCLQSTLSHYRALCSHRAKRIKRLDNAIRVLDIITSKTRVDTSSQVHLRLIQDFLQTDSNHFTQDFASSSDSITVRLPNVFDEILESSVFSEENSVSKDLDLHEERLRVDASVLSNAVSSYGSTRDIRRGIPYHCLAIRCGFVANVYVGSSLISLYSKCYQTKSAYKLFEEMPVRNVVSWTAIIAAFAQEWEVEMCLELYRKMRDSTLNPNEYTFTSILSACTGSGAFGQGRSVHCQTIQMGFDSYVHVANALISMYCKCGSVDESFYVFNNMPSKDIVSWNSMIAGLHRDVWIGIQAAESRLFLEPECAATHVQLANLYASVKCWDQAARVRKLMKDKGLKTNTGYSWIDIKNQVYRFRAEDKSNTRLSEILAVLDCLVDHMKTSGFLPEMQVEHFDDALNESL